jgi:hypothetical protein
MPTPRHYSLLGQAMDHIASKRGIRGPYDVAAYIREKTGGGVSGPTMSNIYNGKNKKGPSGDQMRRFIKAFNCTDEETIELAMIRTFPPGIKPQPKPEAGLILTS